MSVDRSVARDEGTSRLGPGSRPAASRPSRRSVENDDEDEALAAGDEGSSQGTPGTVQAEAEQRVETLEQKAGRLERELRTATSKRIPDLQSALDTTRNELAQARDVARRAAEEWPTWLRDAAAKGLSAADILKELEAHNARRAQQSAQQLMAAAEPQAIITGLIDSDDPDDLAFARHLRMRQKQGWPITRANLEQHREDFKILSGAARGEDGKGKDESKAAARKGPPKLAGAGGRDLGGTTTGWKPGIPTNDLLGQGFAEARAGRR